MPELFPRFFQGSDSTLAYDPFMLFSHTGVQKCNVSERFGPLRGHGLTIRANKLQIIILNVSPISQYPAIVAECFVD